MQSIILRTTSGLLLGLLSLFSVFMLLRGHNDPGGGFVGGLLLAAAVALRSLSHGPTAARKLLRIRPGALVGIGIFIAVSAAVIGLLSGGAFFEPVSLVDLPILGHASTVLLFDVGVYMVVAGTATWILLELSDEEL